MPKSTSKPSEASIQQEIVLWYRNTHCLKHHNPRCMIFSVPNESNRSRAMKLMQTGLYPGCADLVVIHNTPDRYVDSLKPTSLPHKIDAETYLLFIEVKRPTCIQSDKQKQFQAHCNQMGLTYVIVIDLEEFKHVIENL